MKIRILAIATVILCSIMSLSVTHAAQQATSLDALLKLVEEGRINEGKEHKKRESKFRKQKNNQAAYLVEMKQRRRNEEARSKTLEKNFDTNKQKIAAKRALYDERRGELKELFGNLQGVSGEYRSIFSTSIISAEFPNRTEFLDSFINKLKEDTALPSIDELEQLWFFIQQEMTEQSKVSRFTATVETPKGEKDPREVIRIGSYNVVSEGKYLLYSSDTASLYELPSQPQARYTETASDIVGTGGGELVKFGVDPTGAKGGSLLRALISIPGLHEQWEQGGKIGLIISILGAIALVIALIRMMILTAVGGKVNSQLKSRKANKNNPLGRVLAVHEENPNMDVETLELKLSESILQEIPALEKFLTFLKIIATVAPLMGLLGTVTGMIIVFQVITIFGAGDPKMMAGGISGALVTTVLGLVVAIPTILLHTIVKSRSDRIIHILEEQSTGIIAEHSENEARVAGA